MGDRALAVTCHHETKDPSGYLAAKRQCCSGTEAADLAAPTRAAAKIPCGPLNALRAAFTRATSGAPGFYSFPAAKCQPLGIEGPAPSTRSRGAILLHPQGRRRPGRRVGRSRHSGRRRWGRGRLAPRSCGASSVLPPSLLDHPWN
ncbi:unnamed protein product [Lampetra fluviatilis]